MKPVVSGVGARVPLQGSRMCEGPPKVALTLRLPVDRSDSFVVFLSWFEDGMLHKRPVKSLATRSSHFKQWDVFPPNCGIGRRNSTATLVFESRVEERTYAVLLLFVWVLVDQTTTVVQMAGDGGWKRMVWTNWWLFIPVKCAGRSLLWPEYQSQLSS